MCDLAALPNLNYVYISLFYSSRESWLKHFLLAYVWYVCLFRYLYTEIRVQISRGNWLWVENVYKLLHSSINTGMRESGHPFQLCLTMMAAMQQTLHFLVSHSGQAALNSTFPWKILSRLCQRRVYNLPKWGSFTTIRIKTTCHLQRGSEHTS